MGQLDGKSAIVTGGGSGIGQAVAIAFAREGANVMICGRREDSGEETLRMVEASGGTCRFFQCDVSQAVQVEALVAETVNAYGSLDVAFNNAGVFYGMGLLADLTEEDCVKSFDTNVRSTFLCLKYQIQQMLKQGKGGSIINNASAQSHIALGYSAHYTAAKHAILGYTKAAAVDYAKNDIRVNCISPGITLTPMMAGFDPDAPENAVLMSRMPAGKVATPDMIAGTVVFMASDASPYMHGASIALDGGWTAH
ncbi:SDR family oxidoreductase [Croceicoccus sp. BE223]|uniref:SDR family NAD(P)-dependent oxidoreductase n=1 Tax=Croceicoccus sp. BE223 TaxID=2817716 RepID=UPI0028594320|nr:SDR family oxidoreductase [Croceicoccus sp. BE223]MDR7102391.1 NAD(P)-dependent dehydrogenase (short-subunit alcohol dehydrogenase family) [Croceicoccus sp. BE223]